MKERKAFFFEKKKQKTLVPSGRCWEELRDSDEKFFASFFQKRRPCSVISISHGTIGCFATGFCP
jgi:hypothetical protein